MSCQVSLTDSQDVSQSDIKIKTHQISWTLGGVTVSQSVRQSLCRLNKSWLLSKPEVPVWHQNFCKFDSSDQPEKMSQWALVSLSVWVCLTLRDITSLTLQWKVPKSDESNWNPFHHLWHLQLCSLAQVSKPLRHTISQCVREHSSKQNNTTHLPIKILHKLSAHIAKEVSHIPSKQRPIHKYIKASQLYASNSRPPCGISMSHMHKQMQEQVPATIRLFP